MARPSEKGREPGPDLRGVAKGRPLFGRLVLLRRGPLDPEHEMEAVGHGDPPLGSGVLAREEAVAARMASLAPDAVISSDLQRAHHTAALIAERARVDLTRDAALRPRSLGSWQGRRWADVVIGDPERSVRFLQNVVEERPPQGEGWAGMSRRVTRALVAACRRHPRGVVCYVGHAEPIRCMVAEALRLSPIAVQKFQLDPFGVAVLHFQGHEVLLSSWNTPADGDLPGALPE